MFGTIFFLYIFDKFIILIKNQKFQNYGVFEWQSVIVDQNFQKTEVFAVTEQNVKGILGE